MADQSPPRMTWKKATMVLVTMGIFDAVRYACLALAFFAPAFFGLYVTAQTGNSTLGAAAATVSGAAEYFTGIGESLVALGTVLSIVMAVFGFGVLLMWLTLFNRRIFKENPAHVLWALIGVGGSLLFMTWGLHRTQIKKDTERYQEWERAQQGRQKQERDERVFRINLALQQAAQARAQAEAEQAAAEEEAAAQAAETAVNAFEANAFNADLPAPANDADEIPETYRSAA